jgi:hypothetical protein
MDADQLARLERLVDRQDITDCLTRFSRGMDRFDRDLFLAAFHPDALIAAGDFVGGPPELYDWARAMHEQGQIATHHNLLDNTCDIDGNTAHSETYYLFAARNRDESNWIAGRPLLRPARTPRRSVADRIAHQRHRMVRNGPHHADTLRRYSRHQHERRTRAGPDRPVLPAAPRQPPRTAQPAHHA